MSIVMDNRLESSSNEKEEEVRKLQELVKKLEIQNEELRCERQSLLSKTKKSNESVDKNETEKAESETNHTSSSPEKEKRKSQESVPLELGLRLSVALEEIFSSDDETWLFDSPKAVPHKDWLRKDLNDPSLVVVKKSLVKKLDEIANSPKQSPRHSVYSPSSSSGVVSPESPTSNNRGEIDTRTFIRPKKRRSLAFEGFNDENRNAFTRKENLSSVGMAVHNGSREYLGRSSGSLGSEEEDRLSSASDGSYSGFKLADVEDVNALARLQEESLKFPEPRPAARMSGVRNTMKMPGGEFGSHCRSKVPTTGSSGNSATSSQEDLLTSPPPGLNQASPRRTPTRSALPPPRRYPSSTIPHPSRENSDMSTPPDSPYTSHQNLDACNGRNSGSRLPSLTRRLGGSDPRLLDIQTSPNTSRTSSPLPSYSARQGSSAEAKVPVRASRLQTPPARGSRLSAPSPVRIPLGPTQVAAEPPRTSDVARPRPNVGGGGAAPSSVLPRPGSRLQTPATKQRTSQSPSRKFSAQSDWREGCY